MHDQSPAQHSTPLPPQYLQVKMQWAPAQKPVGFVHPCLPRANVSLKFLFRAPWECEAPPDWAQLGTLVKQPMGTHDTPAAHNLRNMPTSHYPTKSAQQLHLPARYAGCSRSSHPAPATSRSCHAPSSSVPCQQPASTCPKFPLALGSRFFKTCPQSGHVGQWDQNQDTQASPA